MKDRVDSFAFRLGSSVFWAFALGVVLTGVQDAPEDITDWVLAAVLAAQFAALGIGLNRPKLGLGISAAVQLASSAAGASPNLGIGVFALLASRFYEEPEDSEKRANPRLALIGVIGLVTFVPWLLDWKSGALEAANADVGDAWESFIGVFFAVLLRANFNLLYTQRASAIEARDQAAATERARIARELHDVVAHQMTVVVAQAQGAEALIEQDPGRVRAALNTISATTRDALVEMRRLVDVDRPSGGPVVIEPSAPVPGLVFNDMAALAANAEAAGVADVHMTINSSRPMDDPLPAGVSVSAYRVVQEALTNAAKHAPGSDVKVVIRVDERAVGLRVENGPASGPARDIPGAGVGLIGMRERVEFFGGTLETGPTPDGGWSVVATFPTLEAPSTSE